ncbi:hypothetical protein AAJ72_14570 [Citromicrobium sp. RCC1885]|uniref:hypothetical protein n=1 Tax=unclassified Citromicrobium TaxID=2630544 RepID=UPI0006C8F33B|nr:MULTISPECIES: hypothetical protein [unclassified Citromicrobium]KPM21567.1 hypothetical protein AAJ72_14570 [Citromicrobium sp. RCC1885]KPM23508.1 hypothetical protein AAJ74_15590 [Citromicrobium sp. RCC1878]OAM06958.1 hypothetical protein A0U43_13665 [Citromicrobium sp. RCC1897]|tara:strand:+ start:10002 stop:10448 length:447 start_codon:yes stop_codon:yes gene_type:complete
MSQNDQRRVFVAQAENGKLTDTDILQVLSAAEIDLATVTIVTRATDLATITERDAAVLILEDGKEDSDLLRETAFSAAKAGVCNIVGLWAPGQTETGIHPAAAKYSTAQIPWDPKKLKDELGSDCEHAFLTPDGEEADPNEVEPNECE